MSGEVPKARLAYFNIFARDIERLSAFYAALFGFEEIVGHRSPIYRCLDAGGVELGFNADAAYDLLNLGARRGDGAGVRVYPTFEIGSRAGLDAIVVRAPTLGASVIKPPYATYYNAWQAVLDDPEGNPFRVNHREGPRAPAETIVDPPWRKP